MGLVARYLEAAGLPTVIAGSARDIVEHCGVPRFAFTDFPLGNPCGKPGDEPMQEAIVEFALDLLSSSTEPRTTQQTPYLWSDDESWRAVYGLVTDDNLQALRAQGELRRQRRAATRGE